MRSRVLILAALVGVVAVALVVAVAVAGAGRSDPLPEISAPELLARMIRAEPPDAVSGEVAWRNALFGDVAVASAMGHVPAQSPLTASGSGRVWLSRDGIRAESQGGGGDQVVVVDKRRRTAWVYDYAADTAQRLTVTGEAPGKSAAQAPGLEMLAPMLTPDVIGAYLQRTASLATLDVPGQAQVAGRPAYRLRMTPAARDTALGAVEAAVDGETMLLLRLDVYARGGDVPVLRYGFTNVRYAPIDPKTFVFTPPKGTQVTTKTIDADALRGQLRMGLRDLAGKRPGAPDLTQKARVHDELRGTQLTLKQADKLTPFRLAWARDYSARRFRHGFVLGPGGPLTGSGAPLVEALAAAVGLDLTGLRQGEDHHGPSPGASDAGTAPTGRTSVLLYGEGLGTIALAQTRTTPELEEQLEQVRWASQLLGSTTVDGVEAIEVGTPLGGVIVWQRGRTTLVAGGMVPMDDLRSFAGSVR